jgi:two-component system nitrogen regulation response regulator GlnG
MSGNILLADDDASLRSVLSQALSREGYTVRATASAGTLAKWVRDGEGDVVVCDVYMGEDNLFDVLPGLRAARPELPVIVMSGQSTIQTALSAAGGGAYDYLPKPFDLDELVGCVRRALSVRPDAKSRAGAANAEREAKLALIGRSSAMQDVYRAMARVASTDLPVLFEGESGVGKQRAARALHDFSRRKTGPFVAVSAAALDPVEAGDDAEANSSLLVRAKGGVLAILGVDDLSAAGQRRLSALVQEAEGAAVADVRFLFTAQRSLADLARRGAFRSDLLYRLNVVTIRLPPLRERREDVPDLARAFLVQARKQGLPEKTLDSGAAEALRAPDWPGNVRELENVLRRLLVMRPEPVLTAGAVERELAALAAPAPAEETQASLDQLVRAAASSALAPGEPAVIDLYDQVLAKVERPLIECVLEVTRGNQIRAAAILGINRNTLRKKIQTLGLRAGRND